MTSAEWVSIVRDLAVSGTALATVFIAYKGLSAWQMELRGRVDFEMARDILGSLNKVKNLVATVRSPAVFTNEVPPSIVHEGESEKTIESGERHRREMQYVYQNRMKPLQEEYGRLITLCEEAEVLWGSEIETAIQAVTLKIRFLGFYIHQRFWSEETREPSLEIEGIVFGKVSETPEDKFKNELDAEIAKVSKIAKPYIAANRRKRERSGSRKQAN
jgi:hypothetical protein